MWASMLLILGCTEQTISVYNTPPAAQITSPENSTTFDPGELIELAGRVADDQGVEALLARWESDIDGELGDSTPDSGGLVYLAVASLSPGTHVVTLHVEDPELLSSSDAISLTIRGGEDDKDGDGYVIGVDCDDNDDAVFPGADEVAWDDIDQDCDGVDLHDYTELYAGGYFTCGASTLGELVCWGSNYFGQISDAPENLPAQLDGGSNHACAHFSDDTATCWGVDDGSDADYGQVTETPETAFAHISAGGAHSCGVSPSGAIRCWGWDESGQVSGVPSGSFAEVSAGSFHTCALQTNKGITCWGAADGGPYDAGQTDAPESINFNAVGSGYLHTCALTVTGGVECWGLTDLSDPSEGGQVLDTPNDDAYAMISVGKNHNCALTKAEGRVTCWGDNGEGQVSGAPDDTDYLTVSAGSEHTCALDSIGRAVCWGDDSAGQSTPP